MLTCGIDIGARTVKVVLLGDRGIIGHHIADTGPDSAREARTALEAVCRAAGVSAGEIQKTVATGYGRDIADFADSTVTEITCHARGVRELLPGVRGVIDIGGQDSKAISLDENGSVRDFAMNDRCAAGTGRFLELMARVFHMSLDDMARAALSAKDAIQITSVCAVFAESEVISLLAHKRDPADVLAGLHRAVAGRMATLAHRVRLTSPVAFVGGVARNAAVRQELERALGLSLVVPPEPQITGALGAALLAAR